MATDPAVEAAHVEAHHAAARVLRSWPEKTGIDVMKAGVAAELAVEAAWPIIAPLIRRQAFNEAAEALDHEANCSERGDCWTHADGLRVGAALLRGLSDGEMENHG